MRWWIDVPLGDRDDRIDLADAYDVSRELQGDDAKVSRALVLLAVTDSACRTYGDLRDRIESASPEERRSMLDAARQSAGLPTTSKVEAMEAFEAANASAAPSQMRDSQGRSQALCGHPGCRNFEPGELPGSIAWVDVKRWWCDQHRHLAADGDLEPWRPRARYSRTGTIEFPDEIEAEAERQRVAAESRQRQRAQREAERAEDARALAKYEAGAAARFRREHIK
jgi:hypothetical protein